MRTDDKSIKPKIVAEYIWIDGHTPTSKLRSKTKVIDHVVNELTDIPQWNFDGSSTLQAEGKFSDVLLKPVRYITDPTRPPLEIPGQEPIHNLLVMCETLNSDETPHASNTRALLRKTAEKYEDQEPWFGIEQEYTLYDGKGGRPYGWPQQSTAFPGPQGPYYCGVGSDEVYGRNLVEDHLRTCLQVGLRLSGVNAEVMPAQWEFQVGPLGPLEVSDQLWLARWVLYRMGEDCGISVKLDPKPLAGDWNGAGAHTNFSTKKMREEGGLEEINSACEKLANTHDEHIKVYGADNDQRLTGKHETCDINTFRCGVGDRGASVRIPSPVAAAERGYLEDRRPAANMDPYQVCNILLETICG